MSRDEDEIDTKTLLKMINGECTPRGDDMEGQGVCKDALPIIGEIWSDLYLGSVLMKNHRFLVVKDMVAALILGVDL